ncbi:MAG: histidine triad nucleotide-binding protein [Oscillospiraceae bacterium]|jgi:histidine triad (HIT) family protein|nr:histidine triad nucleotide-binding protein [Oscillospiraceae bacterium]
MSDCLFCNIAAGKIPCDIVYQDEEILAFRDIQPQAPIHLLIIPKAHAADGAAGINEGNSAIVGKCFEAAAKLASELELKEGFRMVTNNGPAAGQSVPHLHFHLLAGKPLTLQMA